MINDIISFFRPLQFALPGISRENIIFFYMPKTCIEIRYYRKMNDVEISWKNFTSKSAINKIMIARKLT